MPDDQDTPRRVQSRDPDTGDLVGPQYEDAPDERALELRSPIVPVSIVELAALGDRAAAIVQARVTALTTIKKSAIASLLFPTDFLAFKAREEDGGAITCYLQD